MAKLSTPEGILADPNVLFSQVEKVETGQLNEGEFREWIGIEWKRVNKAISKRVFDPQMGGRIGLLLLAWWDRSRHIGDIDLYEAKNPNPRADPNTKVDLRYHPKGELYEITFNASRKRSNLVSITAVKTVRGGHLQDMYTGDLSKLYTREVVNIGITEDMTPTIEHHFSHATGLSYV